MKWWQPIVYIFLPMVLWSIVIFIVLTFFKGNEITISQAILLALFTIVYLFGYAFSWRMYRDARDIQEREDRIKHIRNEKEKNEEGKK